MGFLVNVFGKKQADGEKEYNIAYELETVHSKFDRALHHYEKAAKAGMVEAQYYTGFMYLRGRGTRKDLEKARLWIEKAALANHPKAQYLFSQMYMLGEGVEKDVAKGKEWMEKSEIQGLNKDRPIVSFHVY